MGRGGLEKGDGNWDLAVFGTRGYMSGISGREGVQGSHLFVGMLDMVQLVEVRSGVCEAMAERMELFHHGCLPVIFPLLTNKVGGWPLSISLIFGSLFRPDWKPSNIKCGGSGEFVQEGV